MISLKSLIFACYFIIIIIIDAIKVYGNSNFAAIIFFSENYFYIKFLNRKIILTTTVRYIYIVKDVCVSLTTTTVA